MGNNNEKYRKVLKKYGLIGNTGAAGNAVPTQTLTATNAAGPLTVNSQATNPSATGVVPSKRVVDVLQRNGLLTSEFDKVYGLMTQYAQYGPAQVNQFANDLATDAASSYKKGDIKNFSWDDAISMKLFETMLGKELSKTGMFDNEMYALNSLYSYLPQTSYLESLLGQRNASLAESLKKDEADKLYQSNLKSTRGAWEQLEAEKNNPYMFDPMYGYAMMEYLQGDRSEPFNYDQWDYEYQNLSPADQQARLAGLKKQWDGLDFDALTGRNYKYESQTPGLQSDVNTLQKEIDRRKALAEMETMLRSNPDFDALSAYQETYTAPQGAAKIFGNDAFIQGLDDQQRFINAQTRYADRQLAGEYSGKVKQYLSMGLDLMTPAEIANYNVALSMGPEQAEAYLELLAPELNARRAEVQANYYTTRAGDTLAGAIDSAGTILTKPQGTFNTIWGAATGEYDPNAAIYDITRNAGITRSEYGEHLGKLAPFQIFGEEAGTVAYNILMSVGDMLMARGIGGMVGGLSNKAGVAQKVMGWTMASQSGADTYLSDLQNGKDPLYAAMHGIANGAVEMWSESGFIDSLFDDSGKFLTRVAKSATSEGLEEWVSEGGQMAVDLFLSYMTGQENEIQQTYKYYEATLGKDKAAAATLQHYANNFAIAGLSGFASGGGTSVVTNAATEINNRTTGKDVTEQGDPERMVEIAKSMDPNSEVYQIAAEIETSTKKGQKMPLGKLGRLTQEMGKVLGEQYADLTNGVMNDAITERLIELGSDPEAARRNADVIRKIVSGIKLTVRDRMAVAWNGVADLVTKEILGQTKEADAVKKDAAPEEPPEGLKNYSVGNDINQLQISSRKNAASRQTQQEDIGTRLVEAGYTDEEAKKLAPIIQKQYLEENLTKEERALIEGDGRAEQVLNELEFEQREGQIALNKENADVLMSIAENMPEDSTSREMAKKIQDALNNRDRKSMTFHEIAALSSEMLKEVSKGNASVIKRVLDMAIENRLVEMGETRGAARRNARTIRRIYLKESVSLADRMALRELGTPANEILKEFDKETEFKKKRIVPANKEPYYPEWVQKMHATAKEAVGETVKKQLEYRQALTSKKNVSTAVQEAKKNAAGKVRKGKNGKAAGKETSFHIAYDNGSGVTGEGDLEHIERTEDGKLQMVIKNGDEKVNVDIGDFTQADGEGTATLLESIKYINDNLHDVSAEEANAMLQSYKVGGGDAGRFVESYETLYLRGYSDVANDTNLPATDLDGTLAKIAVDSGKRQAEADENTRKQRASEYRAIENPVAGWLGVVNSDSQVKGSGDLEGLSEALERMTESQRVTAETAIELGKAIGVNVVLYESDKKNMSRIANGSFDQSTHTVYLDVNASLGSAQDIKAQKDKGTLGYAIMRTMGHELTHYLEAGSPEMYAKYKRAVLDALKASGEDTALLIRQKIDRALANGKKLTYNGAVAEVIADASEYMLQDSKFTTRLDNSLRGKVKAFVQNFMGKVKEIFSKLTSAHRESAALREMVDGVYRYTGQLQELWDAGFEEILAKGTMEQTADAAEAVESIPVEELEATRKFSMDRDVEVRDDDLIAVHNLKESDVMGTLELGGFPMPSIAIVRAKDGHTMYGDYSVVFGKETIDPKADTKNRVYGADAWTPVFPVVETEILDDEMYEVQQEAESLAKQVDDEYGRKARTWFGNFGGMDSTTKTMEDIQDSAWNNSGMVAAYLADQGETVEILEKDVPVERGYNPARADMYDQLLDIVDVLDLVDMKAHELIDTYGDRLAEEIPRPFARMNANWKAGDRQAGVRMVEIFRQAVAYEGSGRDTSEKLQKAKDYYATDDAMRARVDRSDFNAWVKEKMQRTFGAKGIYNGKERFTPSGNRRTFKQIHDDVTAKNVVKSMASQQESNIPATDAKGLMAAAASMYKSIAEIKGDVSRLGKISDEEYSARIAAANNAHHELLNALEAWDYDQIEAVGEVLVQAAKKRMSATEIAALLKKNGYKATKKTGELAADLIHQVQTIPSGYFEAKPARVVEFDEIKMIVAPDTMPVSLAKALDERGIPYTTYDGSEADRLKKMNDLPGVRFSMRDGPVTDDEVLRALKWCAQLTARNDRSYDWNYVPVRANTPHYILADLEEKDVPMVMNVNKTRQALTKEGKAFGESVGHGYTPKEMADLFKKIDQPEYFAYSMQRGNYGVVVEHKGNGVVFIIAPPANMNADQLLSEHGGRRTVAVTIFQRESVEDAIFYLENGGYKERPVPAEAKGNHVPERTKESVNHSVLQVDEKVNPGLRYSDRDLPTDITVRDYLAEMEPTDRMNETEKILLKRYQETLGKLRAAEKNAAEQDEILKTAHGDELTKAKNRWQIYRKQADRYARELARAERAEGFAGMLATGQQLVDKYLTGGYTRIADASDELDAEIKGIEKKLKAIGATLQGAEQSQKDAHARGLFNQTELNAAAKQLKDSYASRMSVKEISNRLALAYGEIYADNGAEGAKRFADAAKELAQDIVYSSKYRYRSETLSLIAEEVPVISLTETDKQEIKNAGLTISQYKRGIAPFVKVAEGASDLSSYVSNAEAYGGQIANILGTDTEGNLAMALYNVIQAERSSEQAGTFEGMTEGESISSVMVDIMSANLPMTTDSTTLDYLRKEMLKQAGTSQAAAKAVEGAIQSAKTATRKASSLWHRAVQEVKLSGDVIDYYRALDEQRRLMDLAEQKKALSEQLKTDAAKKIHEQVEKQRTEYREREQRAREYRKTREGVEKLRRGIGRKVKRLNTLRVRETDQKHVPQELQHVADLVMQTFTESSLGRLAFPEGKMNSLARTYRELKLLENDATYYWDDEIDTDITNLQALGEAYSALRNREGDVPSRFSLEGVELETEILQGVDAIVSNVMQMIDSTNDAFLTQRSETFSEFANKAGEKLRAHDDHKVYKGWRGKLQNMLDELIVKGNMTPIYFFEHLQNQEMLDVFNELREGQNLYAQIVAEGKAFMESTRAKHNYGAWVNDGKLTMKTGQGHTIELTREEAAEIYAIAKREAANKLYQTEHLLYGGFQYKNIAEKMNEDGKTQQKNTPHQLDKADIAHIGEWLTAEQKAYADELVGFLSTTMADYGNQASMDMYGYKKFTEQYYIPFHTSAEQRFLKGDEGPQGENAGTGRVKNSGFTRKLQHKANQTLLVGGISDTVADHIHKMAAYAAMVQPIENMKRLMNHQVLENDGTSNTIRALIGQKYGQAAQDYLMQLLKDANGATMSDHRASGLTDKLVGAFKRGAVMASASVVLQQPTAMARAMAYINPKYFANNPFYRPSKGTWDELMKYSGTAVIKDMGKFDVGMGLTATQYILDENLSAIEAYRRLKDESKTKAGKAAYDRFMNWLTAAPGVADQWTWGLIWKAVKDEQAELHPEMDKSSEAFLNLCGARFDDVIDHTQVYDSVLTRSNLMRGQDFLSKSLTAFKSEPTLSLNMLYDAVMGKHTSKQRGAIIGGVIASQVLAGALAALVQAWNDDDDERNWLEKYADRATGNVLDNLNPLKMIPGVSDIISLCEGYDVARQDMEVAADVINYGKNFFSKAMDPDKTLGLRDYENFVGTLANLLGFPAKNLLREVRRTWNMITKTDWSAPNAFGVGQAMKENLLWYGDSKTTYYQRITTALIRGETQLAEDYKAYMLASQGVDEDKLTQGIRTAYKDAYEKGGIDKDAAIAFLLENNLVTGDTEEKRKQSAFQYVDKWEEGTDGYSAYNTLKDAYAAINFSEIEKAWKELTNNGYTDKQVKEQSRTLLKKLVQDGSITTGQATQLLKKWCPYAKDSDNTDKPKEWANGK